MPELWIPVTIAAAFFQNLRSAFQKHLKGRLSNTGAGYSRFVYALPIVACYVWMLNHYQGMALPDGNAKFYLFCFLGSVCQILFTVFLLRLFAFQSFAVGTTFSKLEVVMVAVLGALILGDSLNFYGIAAILISTCGLFALSLGQAKLTVNGLLSGILQKQTAMGLICAAWLGGSVVFFRGAALALAFDEFVMAAGYTLLIALIMQTFLMGSYLVLKEPGEITRVFKEWRYAGLAGLFGALASIGWFTAFTLQNASYVRAVGQIELLFTFIATVFFFREKVSRFELIGMILVVTGIVLLLVKG
ncbi:MAG: EamA family transporter [Acidiferrobacterales bacterium]|nr:EamA family transporter [Acidiferrobacterales bacterium]